MADQDNTNDLLHKIWHPDFEIKLHYPDDSITKNQRLLSNLARLGYYLILDKKHSPFIRIKHAESGKNLVNDFFSVAWDRPIERGLEVHYFWILFVIQGMKNRCTLVSIIMGLPRFYFLIY